MQKSTITYKGVEYPIRTLDIRSIPTWEADCYANARIGDIRLNMALDDSKEATAIDDGILFYIHKSKLEKWSDKKLLEFLKLHLF